MSDEAPRTSAEARAALKSAAERAKRRFQALQVSAREQHVYARAQQAHRKPERAKLDQVAPTHPDANTRASIDLLLDTYAAMEAMQALVIAAFDQNIKVLDSGVVPKPGMLVVPSRLPGFFEQKRRMHLAHARYLMRFNAVGVDAALRAAGHDGIINPVDGKHAAERKADVDDLAAAAAKSQALATWLEKLGADLAAVKRICVFGVTGFAGWAQLDAAQRKAFVTHPDWALLEGHLDLLRELQARSHAFEPLRKRFVAWKPQRPKFLDGDDPEAPAPRAVATDLQLSGGDRASKLRLF